MDFTKQLPQSEKRRDFAGISGAVGKKMQQSRPVAQLTGRIERLYCRPMPGYHPGPKHYPPEIKLPLVTLRRVRLGQTDIHDLLRSSATLANKFATKQFKHAPEIAKHAPEIAKLVAPVLPDLPDVFSGKTSLAKFFQSNTSGVLRSSADLAKKFAPKQFKYAPEIAKLVAPLLPDLPDVFSGKTSLAKFFQSNTSGVLRSSADLAKKFAPKQFKYAPEIAKLVAPLLPDLPDVFSGKTSLAKFFQSNTSGVLRSSADLAKKFAPKQFKYAPEIAKLVAPVLQDLPDVFSGKTSLAKFFQSNTSGVLRSSADLAKKFAPKQFKYAPEIAKLVAPLLPDLPDVFSGKTSLAKFFQSNTSGVLRSSADLAKKFAPKQFKYAPEIAKLVAPVLQDLPDVFSGKTSLAKFFQSNTSGVLRSSADLAKKFAPKQFKYAPEIAKLVAPVLQDLPDVIGGNKSIAKSFKGNIGGMLGVAAILAKKFGAKKSGKVAQIASFAAPVLQDFSRFAANKISAGQVLAKTATRIIAPGTKLLGRFFPKAAPMLSRVGKIIGTDLGKSGQELFSSVKNLWHSQDKLAATGKLGMELLDWLPLGKLFRLPKLGRQAVNIGKNIPLLFDSQKRGKAVGNIASAALNIVLPKKLGRTAGKIARAVLPSFFEPTAPPQPELPVEASPATAARVPGLTIRKRAARKKRKARSVQVTRPSAHQPGAPSPAVVSHHYQEDERDNDIVHKEIANRRLQQQLLEILRQEARMRGYQLES